MNPILRFVVGVLVGVVAFGVVAAGVTAGFEPRIEFSLLIALPMGLYAGVTALAVSYVGLWYRDQSASGEGTASRSVTRTLWAGLATVVDFVVVTALGVGIYFLADESIGIGLLVAGLPVTLVLAAVVGYVVGGRPRGDDAGSSSPDG